MEEYTVLERSIFDTLLKPLSIGGQASTGSGIASLLEAYVTQLFSGSGRAAAVIQDIQSMPTQHELMSQMAGKKAVKAAQTTYTQAMKAALTELPVTTAELQACHRPSYEAAREAFESIAYLGDPSVSGYRRQMDEAIAVCGNANLTLTLTRIGRPSPCGGWDANGMRSTSVSR